MLLNKISNILKDTFIQTVFKRSIPFAIVILMLSLGGETNAFHEPKKEAGDIVIEAKMLDPRAEILRDYLAKYNSPLTVYAQDFIDAADMYGLDWKLLPAITGVESTFGKNIPGGHHPIYTSYNGWGWGVYGDQVLKFKSWRDGIFTVSKGLKEKYINRGLTNPYAMNRVYAASPTWGAKVSYFLQDLANFEKNHSLSQQDYVVSTLNLDLHTAGTSAALSGYEQTESFSELSNLLSQSDYYSVVKTQY